MRFLCSHINTAVWVFPHLSSPLTGTWHPYTAQLLYNSLSEACPLLSSGLGPRHSYFLGHKNVSPVTLPSESHFPLFLHSGQDSEKPFLNPSCWGTTPSLQSQRTMTLIAAFSTLQRHPWFYFCFPHWDLSGGLICPSTLPFLAHKWIPRSFV